MSYSSIASLALLIAGCGGTPGDAPPEDQAKGESRHDDAVSDLIPAELLLELPDNCNTPDALCLLPDGNVILSVPNVND